MSPQDLFMQPWSFLFFYIRGSLALGQPRVNDLAVLKSIIQIPRRLPLLLNATPDMLRSYFYGKEPRNLSNQYKMRVMMRAGQYQYLEVFKPDTKLTAQSFQAIGDLFDLSGMDTANIGH